MSQGHNVKIEVFGTEYTIRTSESEEVTRSYAQYIDSKMRDISNKTGNFEPNRISTLAMLSITHELFTLRNQFARNEEEMNRRVKTAMDKISSILKKSGAE